MVQAPVEHGTPVCSPPCLNSSSQVDYTYLSSSEVHVDYKVEIYALFYTGHWQHSMIIGTFLKAENSKHGVEEGGSAFEFSGKIQADWTYVNRD